MILLPYAHERQTVQRLPYITFGLIVLNVLIFLLIHYGANSVDDYNQKLDRFQQYVYEHHYLTIPAEGRKYFESWQLEELDTLHEASNTSDYDPETLRQEQQNLNSMLHTLKRLEKANPYDKYGYSPAEPSLLGLFTCMFVHGGWLHLLGNIFFLYLAGCSIEDLWGRPLYIGFYLLSGIVATAVHAAKFPTDTQPIIGASGAIAGLMGAFMVRLYNTKISFFYMIWFWVRGTFKAPAYIMLPLWLAQQFFYAMLDEGGHYGVAFWAHIGGFVFGALFAFAMMKFEIEEKYITPKIEKKVGLVQNPDYLRAMNLSEQGNFPDALILLHRVVKTEPNHLEAFLEMKRIAEINKDASSYNKFNAAIFDILLRTRDWDLLLDLYHQFRSSPLREVLPAKSLLGLGTFFEETLDFGAAAEHYQELTANYPDDPLSMRAYGKLARLYLDKLKDRDKGIECFWCSYHHPLADSQWRAALQSEIRKYQIPESSATTIPSAVPVPAAKVAPTVTALSFNEIAEPVASDSQPAQYDDSTQAFHDVAEEPPLLVAPRSFQRDASDTLLLPDPGFDGEPSEWQVVACKLSKLTLKGIQLRKGESVALLTWKKIRTISVARIRILDPSNAAGYKTSLLLDMIAQNPDTAAPILYRLQSDEITFTKIFPLVEQTFEEAFQNFMGILIKNSGARCIPNPESCVGPNFATYPELSRYETRLKEKL